MADDAAWVFEAHVYRQGILRCVDVPPQVAAALDDWQYPAVVATVSGRRRATTLRRRREGGFRLFLHDELRKAAGVDAGDQVCVELVVDDAPTDIVPEDVIDRVPGTTSRRPRRRFRGLEPNLAVP